MIETEKRQMTWQSALFFALIAIFLIGVAVFFVFGPTFFQAETTFLPGDANRFEPITVLPEVVKYAGAGSQLVSITFSAVHSDGTLDLNADTQPEAYTLYRFYRQLSSEPVEGQAQLSAKGSKWYQTVTVRAYRPGRWVTVEGEQSYSYLNLGMEREAFNAENALPGGGIGTPPCTLSQIWQGAIDKGAPKDSLATITYDETGYRFVISAEPPFTLDFDNNCAVK
jgi:hypothetical protein